MPLTIGQTFAGYRILQLLGSGGMGEVYLADHPRLPRRDALKILRSDVSEGDDQYRQRFIQEADLAGRLWHPNIVRVNDRGDDDGRLWIAMDFIDGTDAAHLLRGQPGGLPPRQVLDIVTAVADALDYAHDNGLLHRDVKPANILLTDPVRGTQRVLLADFGIARQVGDPRGLTATNMTLGTVSYSAPEQLIGGPIDGRADQYALAATAFDLLSGTPPFQDSNPAVVIGQHLHSPPPELSSRRPDLANLDQPLVRALAKDPSQRFRSCGEFAEALTRAAAVSSETFDARGFAAAPGGPSDTPTPNPPPTAPMTDNGQATRARGLTPLVVVVLGALALGVAVLIGVLLARNAAPGPAASQQASPSASPPIAAPPPPVTVTVSASTSSPVPVPAPPASAPMVLDDADIHGFVAYNGAARCNGYDRAVVILRTTKSALVVCQSAGGAYYRGLRLSDEATITLSDITVDNSGGQVIVTNPADDTRAAPRFLRSEVPRRRRDTPVRQGARVRAR